MELLLCIMLAVFEITRLWKKYVNESAAYIWPTGFLNNLKQNKWSLQRSYSDPSVYVGLIFPIFRVLFK